jgi:lysozyme family protein
MISTSSNKWKAFVAHVLKYEGGTSSDQNDPANSCYPGGIHTNKGVTYCTFQNLAPQLGIAPANYSRFLNLTTDDISKFLYAYYTKMQADKFSPEIGFSLCEASWGSGPRQSAIHLQKALNQLGKKVPVDGVIGASTISAANSVSQSQLFDLFWKDRIAFLKSLSIWSIYGVGWMNRVNSFLKSFPVAKMAIGIGAIIAVLGAAYYFLVTDKAVEKELKKIQI